MRDTSRENTCTLWPSLLNFKLIYIVRSFNLNFLLPHEYWPWPDVDDPISTISILLFYILYCIYVYCILNGIFTQWFEVYVERTFLWGITHTFVSLKMKKKTNFWNCASPTRKASTASTQLRGPRRVLRNFSIIFFFQTRLLNQSPFSGFLPNLDFFTLSLFNVLEYLFLFEQKLFLKLGNLYYSLLHGHPLLRNFVYVHIYRTTYRLTLGFFIWNCLYSIHTHTHIYECVCVYIPKYKL